MFPVFQFDSLAWFLERDFLQNSSLKGVRIQEQNMPLINNVKGIFLIRCRGFSLLMESIEYFLRGNFSYLEGKLLRVPLYIPKSSPWDTSLKSMRKSRQLLSIGEESWLFFCSVGYKSYLLQQSIQILSTVMTHSKLIIYNIAFKICKNAWTKYHLQ